MERAALASRAGRVWATYGISGLYFVDVLKFLAYGFSYTALIRDLRCRLVLLVHAKCV